MQVLVRLQKRSTAKKSRFTVHSVRNNWYSMFSRNIHLETLHSFRPLSSTATPYNRLSRARRKLLKTPISVNSHRILNKTPNSRN